MNNSEQKSAQATRKRQHSGDKTKLTYWRARIFKPVYVRDGVKMTSPNYSAEIQHKGKRVRWSLGPANPEAAAARARDLYLYLISNGWEATLAKYRPSSIPKADPCLSDFVEALKRSADLEPRTLAAYLSSLRKIVADLAGLSSDQRKYGHGRGRRQWLEKVHAVRLSELSPAAIQQWKRDFLQTAAQDPVSQRSARVSVNSFLRQAKSLFSPKVLEHLGIQMPDPLPFSKIAFEPRQSTKYRSSFDVVALIETARNELASVEPELYKTFLLATFAGLRRKEIDLLEWSAFRWNDYTIRVETTAYFSAKSEDSLGDVAIDQEVMELFRGYAARATGPFVIESAQAPRSASLYDHYRCNETFERLIAWLRDHGVRSLKPLHALRKEFGSLICATYGIHAASRALRHSAVAITDAYYTDSRKRTSLGMGHLLSAPNIVAFEQKEVA